MKFDADFDQAPLLLIWEVTRSCALACRHCRASAEDRRDPRELSLEEGKALMHDVRHMGTPLLVLTGGDPLQRDDLEDLIRWGKKIGLTVATIPAATPRLTRARVFSLKAAGLDQMALSLDGATAEKHDSFRGVPGTFAKVMEAAQWAHEAGLPLQVNTVLGAWNFQDFEAIAALVERLGVVFWEVFFLVPTGRGSEMTGCTPAQFEIIFDRLSRLSLRKPFIIKVTEGQHFRRYLANLPKSARGRMGVSPFAVNAGRGFCFVDHIGNICPSGFLPISCGNVREIPVAEVYRDHSIFRQLRDASLLRGRCGVCEYREMCTGGSRARAYALTGDFLAEDPCCAYTPAANR